LTPDRDFSYHRDVFGRRITYIAGALALFATTSPAMASPGEVYGTSARAIGRAGAMAADAEGFESLHYNPAGLAQTERIEISGGYQYALHKLSWASEIDGAPNASGESAMADPHSLHLGLTIPAGERLAIGAYISTLPSNLVRIRAGEPEDPYFSYFENRAERIYVLLGAAAQLSDRISFGLAVNMFAQVNGLARATEGPTRDVEPTLAINARALARVIFGFKYALDEDSGLGFTFRQRFEVPFTVATQNAVGGVPFTVDVDASVTQTPNQLVLGYFRNFDALRVELDFGWYRNSQMKAPLVAVDAEVLGIELSSGQVERPFQDSIDLRLGGEYALALQKKARTLHLRGGLHYHSPMTREAVGPSNALDGHKIGAAVGGGVRFPLAGDFAARTDFYFMTTGLIGRDNTKNPDLIFDESPAPGLQTSNPGYGVISGSGAILAMGATLTLELPK
jgi:long-chain fatty acid transport protein